MSIPDDKIDKPGVVEVSQPSVPTGTSKKKIDEIVGHLGLTMEGGDDIINNNDLDKLIQLKIDTTEKQSTIKVLAEVFKDDFSTKQQKLLAQAEQQLFIDAILQIQGMAKDELEKRMALKAEASKVKQPSQSAQPEAQASVSETSVVNPTRPESSQTPEESEAISNPQPEPSEPHTVDTSLAGKLGRVEQAKRESIRTSSQEGNTPPEVYQTVRPINLTSTIPSQERITDLEVAKQKFKDAVDMQEVDCKNSDNNHAFTASYKNQKVCTVDVKTGTCELHMSGPTAINIAFINIALKGASINAPLELNSPKNLKMAMEILKEASKLGIVVEPDDVTQKSLERSEFASSFKKLMQNKIQPNVQSEKDDNQDHSKHKM